MAILANYLGVAFGIGDKVRVTQQIQEGEKTRSAVFEGIVIAIRGRDENKSFRVRRLGEQKIGIERIFPLALPGLEKIEVLKKAVGLRRAKLYYLRSKTEKEIAKIYHR
jgi:large subunit ribosomal protein L19